MRTADAFVFPHAARHFFTLATLVFALVFSPQTFAQELKIGVGNFKPYFNGDTGLFTDLIVEVFKEMPQYQAKISTTPMSNYRLLEELNAGSIDGAANIFWVTKLTAVYRSHSFDTTTWSSHSRNAT